MLEFPGQVLELSMPVGRGTKGPLGHLWVQVWTDDYLNLRAILLLLALLDVVQRSFSYDLGTLRRPSVLPSNCPSVNISCYRISSKTTVVGFFLKLGQNVPLSVY